jgi:dipeptidase
LYADDVVDVAIHYGLYPKDADPLEFSFSDVYNPLDFIGARQGEARVWSIFSQIADTNGVFQHIFQQYAMGTDLKRRMPLYVNPVHRLSPQKVMHLMTSHYEGTVLDSSGDVGAGLFASPYRPRPLVWDYEDKGDHRTSKDDDKSGRYHNERSVATPKTGWSFVAQVRPWMPPALAVLGWYALDDSSTAPRLPIYGSARRVPVSYAGKGSQDGVKTPLLEFDLDKAFWVQNMVSNFCYSRWEDVYPTLRNKIDSVQREFQNKVKIVDDRALQAYQEKGAATAIRYVTQFGDTAGGQLHKLWMNFYGELFVKFRDFYIITAADNAVGINAQEPGMSDVVKERIVQDTGDHYKVVDGGPRPDVVRGESWKARAIQPGLVAMVEQLDKSAGAADPDSDILQAIA